MDPDATLEMIRGYVARIQEQEDAGAEHSAEWYASQAEGLAEYVQALDNWICNGGYLPKPWQEV